MTITEGFLLIGLFLLYFAVKIGLHLYQIREWRKEDRRRYDREWKTKKGVKTYVAMNEIKYSQVAEGMACIRSADQREQFIK